MAKGPEGESPINVTKYMKGIKLPATRDDLVEHARSQGADDHVIQALEQFPDEEYGTMADVMKGFKQAE